MAKNIPEPRDPYPEHTKLKAVREASQTIGEFVEWLGQNGYAICERREPDSTRDLDLIVPAEGSRRHRDMGDAFAAVLEAVADAACIYWPTPKRLPQALLSQYFEIDENKLEAEKRQMLDDLRAAAKKKKTP